MVDKDPQDLAAEVERLTKENEALKQQAAAEKGPDTGTVVCYQREGEGFCRPARIASEGFTEHVPGPGGATHRHALIEYGEPPWIGTAAHTFQTDRHYDPMAGPNTWHLPDECPRNGAPGCPYAKNPVWPPPRETQAP